MRQADVAIRLYTPRQPDLIKRLLFEAHSHVYASQAYLDKHGTPDALEDMDNHRLIVWGSDSRPPIPNLNWILEAGSNKGARKPVLTINNIWAIKQAVLSGAGIASLPDYIVRDSDDLVRVLPATEGPMFQAYFVYPEELRSVQRVNVFRDFLLRKVAETRF